MGLKFLAFSGLLLAVSAFSVEKKSVGSGCVDLLCPDTAMHFGLRNLVNDDTLRTDSCTSCTQCTENGYSLCLRPRDSRASRASGGCSCAHQLAANCHNDLTQKTHPANLTMHLYTACYTDALQRPPQPLAVNENSSVVVTIEPFWLEPYWRHLTVENLTLHYKFNVKVPEHCEGEVESTPNGVHTCVASVHVDLSDSKDSVSSTKDEEDDYEHSDNYDQYDDDLPPEVQFDRDVFAGAKELESYYTAVVRRPRQIKLHAPKNEQIRDSQSPIESDHLKFDLKPELYGLGERFYSPPEEEQEPVAITTTAATDTTTETETKLEKDESATSEELGGTNFFEDDAKKEAEEEKADEKNKESEEDGVVKVNLEDIEPTKLKSQEEEETETTTTTITTTATSTEESETTTNEVSKEEEGKDEEESEDDDDSGEDSETTTVELVEGEESEGNEEESEETFLSRFTESFDFDRVRLVFLITLGGFIICVISALCWIHCGKNCCKKKTSKTSNGYRYTTANQPTPLVSHEKESLRQ